MGLEGKRVVILAENDYEDLELLYPWLRLREAGAEVHIVGTGSASVYNSKHGYPAKVDAVADAVRGADYDAVIVPGGFAPDRLRRYPAVLNLVRDIFNQGKVVAGICHAGWVLISAGILRGKRATSVSAIKDDMVNAGATWLDQEVVQDGNLITSRTPADLPAFLRTIIVALGGSTEVKATKATSALDALKIAIQAEEESEALYLEAMRRTQDPGGKRMFKELAEEEKKHKALLQAEYSHLAGDPAWVRYAGWREVL